MDAGTPADGRSLKDLRLETETGMFVLAVQRGARWIYRPRGPFILRAGDRAIASAPRRARRSSRRSAAFRRDGGLTVDAFLYLQVRPGAVEDVVVQLENARASAPPSR